MRGRRILMKKSWENTYLDDEEGGGRLILRLIFVKVGNR
jgi:hypothetical protein